VLEEIVGEIEDEFDREEPLYSWLGATAVRVDPKIGLEDLAEVLGWAVLAGEEEESSETLGGLIYEAAGNVPEPGDTVDVAGLAVTVEKVEEQRILEAVIRAPEPLPGWPGRQGAGTTGTGGAGADGGSGGEPGRGA
jgi:CBS domain containing-hemolysin-like protein